MQQYLRNVRRSIAQPLSKTLRVVDIISNHTNNTEINNTDIDSTEIDNTEINNTEIDNTEIENTESLISRLSVLQKNTGIIHIHIYEYIYIYIYIYVTIGGKG
jgi:hypothetical protein